MKITFNATILEDAEVSGVITAAQLKNVSSITILPPSETTGDITIEVSSTRSGDFWGTLQSGGTDVALVAGKATVLNSLSWMRMRFASSAAEAADRVFYCSAEEDPH